MMFGDFPCVISSLAWRHAKEQITQEKSPQDFFYITYGSKVIL